MAIAMPPITFYCRNLGVIRFAESHQVVAAVRSTLGERKNTMDLLGWSDPAFLLALLTQRVRRNVTVQNAFPSASVPTAYCRVPVVLLVAFVLLAFMFLAAPAVHQVGTAGKGTWSLRHCITTL